MSEENEKKSPTIDDFVIIGGHANILVRSNLSSNIDGIANQRFSSKRFDILMRNTFTASPRWYYN